MALCDHVLHTGVLFKRGSGANNPFGRTNWKTRYFVLTPTALAYYTYEGGKWKGEIEFVAKPTRKLLSASSTKPAVRTTIEVMPADSKKTGRSCSTIWRIAIHAPKRRLLLAASSEWEMNVWVEKLQHALRVAYSDTEKRQQRMSLPARTTLLTPKAFVTDYPSVVHAHPHSRQRPSVGPSDCSSSDDWLHASERKSPPSSATSSPSSSLLLNSPQEPCAFDRVGSTSCNNSAALFALPNSTDASSVHVMGASYTPPPSLQSTTTRHMCMHQHQRLSLPTDFETHVFTDADVAPQPQLPLPSIVDFSNFARSRRRMSIADSSSSARVRIEQALRCSRIDASSSSTIATATAKAVRPIDAAPAALMYEDSDDDDDDNKRHNAHEELRKMQQHKRTLMQQHLQPRSTVEVPVRTGDSGCKAIETPDVQQQRQRFTRVRQWFKRANTLEV